MNTSLNPQQNSRKLPAALTVLALALGLAACGGGGGGGGNGPGSTGLDLVIGDSLPLSGGDTSGAEASGATTTSEDTSTSDQGTTTSDFTTTSEDTTTTTPVDAEEASKLGDSGQKASDLAVEKINAAIDEAGADHSVKVVHADQGPDPDSAVEAASRLVHSDGASCLTGPWGAESFQQVAESIAIPTKVLTISPTPTNDEVTDLNDHDLVDSTALPVSLEGAAIAKGISRELGGAEGFTVNVAASNDSADDSLSQGFIESWQGMEGTVGGQSVIAPPPLDSSDSSGSSYSSGYSSVYSSQVSQLMSGSPDAVLLVVDPTTLINMGSALGSNYAWDPETAWGSDQLLAPGLVDQVGTDVIGGMQAVVPGIPKGEEASEAFVEAFKSAQPSKVGPQPFAAQEFDATILCYLAAVAAGSTDSKAMADRLIDITAPGGEEFTWQQLPDAIKALEDGEDIDYTGASGPIDMNITGEPTSGVYDIYRLTADGLEVAGEVSVSKPNPATP